MDISDKTRVPLFAVAATLPVLIGGIVWLSTIHSDAVQAQEINEKQDVKIDKLYDLLVDIRDRMIRIEEKISR